MSSRIPSYPFRTAVLPFACLFALLLGMCMAPAHGATGPGDWWMFHHDRQHTGRSPFPGPGTPVQKWAYPNTHSTYSSPALGADGTIYVGSQDDKLYAINPDGTEKWAFPTQGLVISSPAIGADGTIYVGSLDDNLYAINPDGTKKWAFPTQGLIISSPTIGTDGTIYIGSQDQKLYAINPNGMQQWAFTTGGDINSSPALGADGTIYIMSDTLYAIFPNGAQKWAIQPDISNVFSSPAVGADGTIYVGADDGHLYAFNPDGTQQWAFTTGNAIYSSPAIGADGTIYIGSDDDKLYAINPNGAQLWIFPTGGYIQSSPALGADGTIYVGSTDGNLYAILPNGVQQWVFSTGSMLQASPALGADGTLYLASPNKLYALASLSPTLTLSKSMSPANAAPGSTVTYTLAYANYDVAAMNVVLADTLPANLAYVTNSATGSNFSYNAGTATLSWTINTLAAGGSGQVSFQATVAGTAVPGNTISNTASISCTAAPTPVTSSVVFTIVSPPTRLAFQRQPSNTVAGVTITPAVTVLVQDANANTVATATNAITLALAANPGGSALGGTVTVNAVNGVATFNTLTVNNVGTGYTLGATAAGMTGATSSAFSITPALPALILSKTVSPSNAMPGDTVTYAIAYNNFGGTAAASNVTLTDMLPANVLYVPNSASGNATWNAVTATLSWSLGTLPIVGSGQVTFQATVATTAAMGDVVSNTANISCTEVAAPVQSNAASFTVIDLRGDWWMFHHDPRHTGCSPFTGPPVPTLKWAALTQGSIFASPSLGADGTIYVGSVDCNLYAINPVDGTPKWQFLTGGYIYSSPAIGVDGTIYVGSSDGNLYALNAADGSPKWSFPAGNAIDSSPVIGADGTIYVGAMDGNLYALHPDGSWLWKYTTGQAIYSSPAISADGMTIYVGSEDFNLYAIDAVNGALKWKYATDNQIWSSPAVDANGNIYVGSLDTNLYAIQPNGTLLWQTATGNAIYSSPALGADGTIYVGSLDNNLYAFNLADGSLQWKAQTGSQIWSSPTIGADGTIYVGSNDMNLYAFTQGGALIWKDPLPSYCESCPVLGADGTIYAGTVGGTLYAIAYSAPTLALTKSVSTPCAQPGSIVSYTLTYSNYGCASPDVVLTDTLPANVTLTNATENPTYDAATSTLSWSLGTLTATASGQVTFQVMVATNAPLGSTINNSATITSANAVKPVSSNTVSFTVVGPQAKLVFQQEPSDTVAGTIMTPSVTVLVDRMRTGIRSPPRPMRSRWHLRPIRLTTA